MTSLTTTNSTNEIEQHVWSALKNSLYAGAKDESIKMVLDYCKAAKLDPMQKPVHIIPLSVKNAHTGKYEYRDIVMPGVGLYRIQAARSNQYAGVSEPEYGEDITSNLNGVEITYPKWCKITVKKIVNNVIVEFSAKEYWIENYATINKDSTAPNSMWRKRPYGQIAKCAEAQALRKAFPEIISHHPTVEEMEGKTFNDIEMEIKNIAPKSQDINSRIEAILLEQEEDEKTLLDKLLLLIEKNNIAPEIINKWCVKAGVINLNELDDEKLKLCINHIEQKEI